MPDRAQVPLRHPGGRAGRILPILLLAALVGGADAWAVSGEPENTAGIHTVTPQACQQLRQASPTNGDLYLACNADRSAAVEGAEPCDLLFADTLIRGDTFGFCADRFANRQVRGEAPDLALVEAGKQVRGTIFGSNIGLKRSGQDRDVFCTSFHPTSPNPETTIGASVGQGTRACVEIFKGGASTVPGSCSGLTVSNSASACTIIEDALKATLTGGEEPVFSHALFLQVLSNLGGPNSQTLFVCKGYSARCADETGATAVNTIYPFGFFETPGCGRTRSGYRCW